MRVIALDDGEAELEEPTPDDAAEPAYVFDGFHIEFSEKLMLTPVPPRPGQR